VKVSSKNSDTREVKCEGGRGYITLKLEVRAARGSGLVAASGIPRVE